MDRFTVGEADGFKEDRFERRQFAEDLTDHIRNAMPGATIALDAPWGAGKTVFLTQLTSELRGQGWGVAYYDAFANDYEEDAFFPLMSSIYDALPDVEQHKNNVKDAALAVGKRLASGVFRVGVRAATAALFDPENMPKGLGGSVLMEVDRISSAIGDKIECAKEKAEERSRLVNTLNEAVSALDGATEADAGFIVIIDELDRCRPDFAVQTLERIKHLYDGCECKFLFGVNIPELAAIVKGYYGPEFSGRRYLQRFFELEFGFPTRASRPPACVQLKEADRRQEKGGIPFYADGIIRSGCLRFTPTPRDANRPLAADQSEAFQNSPCRDEWGLLAALSLARVCRPEDYPALVGVPPDTSVWERLFHIDALQEQISNGHPTIEHLLRMDCSSPSNRTGGEENQLMLRSFPLMQNLVPSPTFPGILRFYADSYLGGRS